MITTKYLHFEELTAKTKTKQFQVLNKLSFSLLGFIKWYAPWRRYCFFTVGSGFIFDAECLADIQDFINKLMLKRKEDRKNG